jgi:DNA-binding beta-propeller fold protein YncE
LPSVSNDLFITNLDGHSVMRWTPGASSGVFVAGTPGVAGSNSTLLHRPMGIKIDSYLNIYVVDESNHRVQMFCANSQTGITIAGTGVGGNSQEQLLYPRGIAFDSALKMYIIQKFLKL